MSATVDLDELLDCCEWVAAGDAAEIDAEGYVNRQTGRIHWCGEGIDDDPPDDIEDGTVYIAVPDLREFDLGRPLALAFVDEYLPQASVTVRGYFRRSGAYRQFKDLLAASGQLDAWHRYEQLAKQEALREWCGENGFAVAPAAERRR